MLLSVDESVIGPGFYFWVMALLMLMMSRFLMTQEKFHEYSFY